MKELISLSANFLAVISPDHPPEPQIELVLILSEPVYEAIGEEIRKRRHLSGVRLTTRPELLRQAATALAGLADECQGCIVPVPTIL